MVDHLPMHPLAIADHLPLPITHKSGHTYDDVLGAQQNLKYIEQW